VLTTIPSQVRIFFCLQPTDMRMSFNGLSGMVRSFMDGDLLSGHLFVFRNRRGDRLKILAWDRDGFVLWYKQLQRGTFRFPAAASSRSIEIDCLTLTLILDGIDLSSVRRQKRYQSQNVIPLPGANNPSASSG
jgi:transposase